MADQFWSGCERGLKGMTHTCCQSGERKLMRDLGDVWQ
jgi:hypothetical protein